MSPTLGRMSLASALCRLAVLDNAARGWDFHYTSCGIYRQGLFTTRKTLDDPTRRCTCGRDEAIAVVLASSVGKNLVREAGDTDRAGGRG